MFFAAIDKPVSILMTVPACTNLIRAFGYFDYNTRRLIRYADVVWLSVNNIKRTGAIMLTKCSPSLLLFFIFPYFLFIFVS